MMQKGKNEAVQTATNSFYGSFSESSAVNSAAVHTIYATFSILNQIKSWNQVNIKSGQVSWSIRWTLFFQDYQKNEALIVRSESFQSQQQVQHFERRNIHLLVFSKIYIQPASQLDWGLDIYLVLLKRLKSCFSRALRVIVLLEAGPPSRSQISA